MKIQQTTLDAIKLSALNQFDDLTYMAFGTGTGEEDISDTTMGTELIRKAFDETPIQSVSTYDFSGYLGLTEENGNTLSEVGLFNASSGGTMRARGLLPQTISKIVTIDVGIGIRTTISVENI